MTYHVFDDADRGLLWLAGWLAILGSISLVAGNVVGSIMVPGHDWISDTVSDLAAGEYEIIQDVALYGYAASLIALALATAHVHLGGRGWNVVILGLALLAVCVIIIAARNEYGDNDSEGIVIHIYVVYLLGLLFSMVFILTALYGAPLGMVRVSAICAVLWTIGAPIFFMMPTAYDGIFERGLGVITVVWVVTFGWQLIRQSRSG